MLSPSGRDECLHLSEVQKEGRGNERNKGESGSFREHISEHNVIMQTAENSALQVVDNIQRHTWTSAPGMRGSMKSCIHDFLFKHVCV